MKTTDKRKQSLYLPYQMLEEVQNEAYRQDRPISWIIQRAWEIAKKDIQQFPSSPSSTQDVA